MNADRTNVNIDTESNSTIEPDAEVAKMSDADKTSKLLDNVCAQRPVTLEAKVPTMEDVRAVMRVDFVNANDSWKLSVPKIVVSRSDWSCDYNLMRESARCW